MPQAGRFAQLRQVPTKAADGSIAATAAQPSRCTSGRGQRPRPAADVQYPLASRHTGQIRELHSQRLRETAHEPAVGLCADLKCHDARVVAAPAYLKKIREPVSDRGSAVRSRREWSPTRGAADHRR